MKRVVASIVLLLSTNTSVALALSFSSSSSSSSSSSPSSCLSSAQRLVRLVSSNDASSSKPQALWVPGVHDALSTRIMVQDGNAKAVFVSGFGVAAAQLAVPDVGICTYAEMDLAARQIVQAVTQSTNNSTDSDDASPALVLVDGDTGHGSAATLRRTICGMAAIGAAAITIEDQVFPKCCTFLATSRGGPTVVDRAAAVTRIRAAVAAKQQALERDGNDILIIGRTDCRATLGLNEAIDRCLQFQAAGCDIVYAENLQSPKEYAALRAQIQDTPLMLAQVQTTTLQGTANDNKQSSSPYLYTLQDVTDLGYQLALYGITGLQATVDAMQRAAREMKQTGLVHQQPLSSLDEIKQVVRYEDVQAFEEKYNCE